MAVACWERPDSRRHGRPSFQPMKSTPVTHVFLRPEGEQLEAILNHKAKIDSTYHGQLAELLAAWSPGEITTLCKALEILLDSHSRTHARLRTLDVSPLPDFVKGQLAYLDGCIQGLNHAISTIKCCARKSKPSRAGRVSWRNHPGKGPPTS